MHACLLSYTRLKFSILTLLRIACLGNGTAQSCLVLPISINLIKIIPQDKPTSQPNVDNSSLSSQVVLTYVRLTINTNHHITSFSAPAMCSSLKLVFLYSHLCSMDTSHIPLSASSCQSPALLKPFVGLPGLLEVYLGIWKSKTGVLSSP